MLMSKMFQVSPARNSLKKPGWWLTTSLLLTTLTLAACGDSSATSGSITAPASSTSAAIPVSPTRPASTTAPATSPAVTAATTPATSPAGSATNGPATSPAAIPDEIKEGFKTASEDLAKRFNLAPGSVQLVSYNQREFSDSSMGCPDPNFGYTQVITPGFVMQLSVNGQFYDYHTSLNGKRAILCGPDGRPVTRKP